MKALLGMLGAAAVARTPALFGLVAFSLIAVVVLCWIIANRSRTENTVALITAIRRSASRNRRV